MIVDHIPNGKALLFMALTWISRRVACKKAAFDILQDEQRIYSPTSIWSPWCQGPAVKRVAFEIPTDSGQWKFLVRDLFPFKDDLYLWHVGRWCDGHFLSWHFLWLDELWWNASANWMLWSPQAVNWNTKLSSGNRSRCVHRQTSVGLSLCQGQVSKKKGPGWPGSCKVPSDAVLRLCSSDFAVLLPCKESRSWGELSYR